MSRTNTRRPGRLRALAVVSALAVSTIAGAAAPAFAEGAPEAFPGAEQAQDVLKDKSHAPSPGNGEFGPQGISWW